MTIQENKDIARRWMQEIWQGASLATMEELFAANFVFNYVSPGLEPNPESYKQCVDAYFIGFPDIQFTLEDLVAEGDKIAVHWSGRGTHEGEYWGFAPTGKRMTFRGISIIHIVDGKIVEEWGYDNAWEWMEQLGAFDS
jgi:steroid delta-isomerase-like uncharacterized protein